MAHLDVHDKDNIAAKALAEEKFMLWKKMSFPNKEALEQATPEAVARYRAGRIAGQLAENGVDAGACAAVDLCCGASMDAIALSWKFAKVYAVDIDPETLECARANAGVYGAKNIEFICNDYKKIALGKMSPSLVFADPSRRTGGKRVKSLSGTQPDTLQLIDFVRSSGAEDLCVEVSHELRPDELPQDCGKEIISLNGEPNCATLYFGRLMKSNYSVVSLPSGARLEADTVGEKVEIAGTGLDAGSSLLRYLYELEEGVVRFGMQKQLHDSLGKGRERVFMLNENFFGAGQRFSSPFFKNSFKVLAQLDGEGRLPEKLARLDAGKVVLRGRFSQEGHLRKKKELEEGLSGKRKLHVFFLDGMNLVCSNLAFR